MSRRRTCLLDPEDQLLLLCLQSPATLAEEGQSARLKALMSVVDWKTFWERAGQQRVQPLVGALLASDDVTDDVPDEIRQAAKSVRMQTLIRNLALQSELQRIAELLHAHGIPVTPLKGTHVATRVLGGLDQRQCGDIDILVAHNHWEAARALLLQSEYAPYSTPKPGVAQHAFHDVPLVRQTRGTAFVVELHRDLTDTRYVTVDDAQLWERITAANAPENPLQALPDEELLVFLSTHLPKHDIGMLRLIADIHRLITQQHDAIDWDHVVRLARSWHADDVLYFSLYLIQELLDTPVPHSVMENLRPARWKRRIVPMLAGPSAMLRPPLPDHLRSNRFRVAYCMMLKPFHRTLHSYWHYILLPPTDPGERQGRRIVTSLLRPVGGIARTVLGFGASIRDCGPGSLPSR